jgi:hypothetical protein
VTTDEHLYELSRPLPVPLYELFRSVDVNGSEMGWHFVSWWDDSETDIINTNRTGPDHTELQFVVKEPISGYTFTHEKHQ